MISLLLLQVALISGHCDRVSMMDSDYWSAPIECEGAWLVESAVASMSAGEAPGYGIAPPFTPTDDTRSCDVVAVP